MNDYLQPDFFRFGHDSLLLVKWILTQVKEASSILDLGAGSGIIGIELANSLHPKKLTLVELQKDYLPFLTQNLQAQLKTNLESEVIISSFGSYQSNSKFDLVVTNPPYYLPGHGQKSPDEKRELARTFHVDDWRVLFETMDTALSDEGRAFFVVKNEKTIAQHLKNALPRNLELKECQNGDVLFFELTRLHKD